MTARITAEVAVNIATGKSTRQGDPVKITLRIEDGPSGEPLVELEFDANTWWDLATGAHMRMTGLTTGHPERLGRKMVVRQQKVPREVTEGLYGNDGEPLVRKWAEGYCQVGETLETRRTNQGWVVLYRSWPETAR